MFESERDLIKKEGINIKGSDFPYSYFDHYIVICNPNIKNHKELVQHLDELKSKVDSHTYEVAILHGAVVSLMRDYHYDFIVAMIKDENFCNWVIQLNKEFEEHHMEIEVITHYNFN